MKSLPFLEQEKPLTRRPARPSSWACFVVAGSRSGKACELLSLGPSRLCQRAAELDIPYFQMTKEDWAAEQASIDSWPLSS